MQNYGTKGHGLGHVTYLIFGVQIDYDEYYSTVQKYAKLGEKAWRSRSDTYTDDTDGQ